MRRRGDILCATMVQLGGKGVNLRSCSKTEKTCVSDVAISAGVILRSGPAPSRNPLTPFFTSPGAGRA